ncbi:hypothetical protein UNDKW_2282 [Undibacterium sp. KW1]|uniref:hypothetical protein n=1 Tax=Undibacterium sp. KW1 TaxID=2058624 RepID=UPI001331D7F2|nr:hypothetical protein [Undibacterium sp. KW1]BBB60555.1 hypothetical protein UNDKW_2282 [Undibacterium sp. KW1]
MNARKILLGVCLVVAAWLALFADKTPDADVVEAVTPAKKTQVTQTNLASTKPVGANAKLPAASQVQTIAAVIDRKQLIAADYKANGNFFDAQSWTPPPPPTAKPPPPPPPTAPPLPFRYLGKKTDDGQIEVYLSSGDRTFIVQEKTIIENIYRVDAIKPTMMSITYLPLNQVQTLQIGSTD